MLSDQRRRQIDDLFRQYGRGVGSYVLARVGNADVAEAITSNVFLIVVRRIEQCRTSPAAWLWSIVRSELARHFRRHRPTVELEETFPDPALSPPDVAAENEMQIRMRLALHRLTDEQQAIIYLKFFLDLPNTDIATELDLSPSNVGVIVHRAMKALREMMEERSPKPEARSRHEEKSASSGKQGSIILLLALSFWVQTFFAFVLAPGFWLPTS